MGTEVSFSSGYVIGAIILVVIILLLVILSKKGKKKEEHYKLDMDLPSKEKKYDSSVKEKSVSQSKKVDDTNSAKLDATEPVKEEKVVKKPAVKAPEKVLYKEPIPPTEEIEPFSFEYFKGSKILIVEDNKINQKILLNVLRNLNTDIDVANNGEEAVEKIITQKQQYDLVLMDISMPIMDGIQATTIIRESIDNKTLPIVTVTAFTSGVEIAQMFEAGANAFLTKPLDIHKLFTVMSIYLDNRKNELDFDREAEILGFKTDGINQDKIRNFISSFENYEDEIVYLLDSGDWANAQQKLSLLMDNAIILGSTKFIETLKEMKSLIDSGDESLDIQKIIFKARFKAILNTYRKYLNYL
jgi:CheY-like chemotaxis protein